MNQLDLFGHESARAMREPRNTRLAAYQSIQPCVDTIQGAVLRHIEAARGATSDEIEQALSLAHQTASARVWELRKMGMVRDSGLRRLTRSGRGAKVWIVR